MIREISVLVESKPIRRHEKAKQKGQKWKAEWEIEEEQAVQCQASRNCRAPRMVMVTKHVVPVPKKDGKVRDYRDKVKPKDDFPLPHIDVILDNGAGSAPWLRLIRVKPDPHELDRQSKNSFHNSVGCVFYKVRDFSTHLSVLSLHYALRQQS